MDLYFKTALVFAHFVLAAFCLVTIIGTDLKLIRHYGSPATGALCDDVARVKRAVTYGLAGLWITGLVIVGYGMSTSPTYLANPKLWFKVAVVLALTLNGVLVHRMGRVLQPGVTLAALDDRTALLLNMAGATSSISWLWACLLGTARAWNGTLSFQVILAYYVASLMVCLGLAIGLHIRQRRQLRLLLAARGDTPYEWAHEDLLPRDYGAVTGDGVVH
jgi:hypothetical protein